MRVRHISCNRVPWTVSKSTGPASRGDHAATFLIPLSAAVAGRLERLAPDRPLRSASLVRLCRPGSGTLASTPRDAFPHHLRVAGRLACDDRTPCPIVFESPY